MLSADLGVSGFPEKNLDVDFKACAIAGRLSEQIHDATVQYECTDGVYEFVVRYEDSKFTFWLPEHVLLRKGMQELEQMVSQIVDRICATRVETAAEQALSTAH
jgi:hypothetical protein